MNPAEIDKLLDDVCSRLYERFDCVQIFINHHQGTDTVRAAKGAGNWFARYGQIVDWIDESRTHTKESVKKRIEEDSDEVGDE